MGERIKYKDRYKYQLAEEYKTKVRIIPENIIVTDYIDLSTEGMLVIKKGYAWDGPSGPTVDTKNFMRGSLVHDALYQLMRHGHLDRTTWRKAADEEIRDICRLDGMSYLRSGMAYLALRLFGGKAASEEQKKAVKSAPR